MDNLAIIIPIYKENKKILEQNFRVFGLYNPYWVIHEKDIETLKTAIVINHNVIIAKTKSHSKASLVNYAVNTIEKELICIFDIESIPENNFFDKCLEEINNGFDCVYGKSYTANTEKFLTDCRRTEEDEWYFILKNMCVNKARGFTPIVGSGLIIKKQVFNSIGGFSNDTVTEDADMTMTLAERGFKVKLVDTSFKSEAPESFIGVLLQRSRWYKGTMQCLKKHSLLKIVNPTLYWVYAWSSFSFLFTLAIVLKYAFIFIVPFPLNLLLLVMFLIQDFEYQYWEFTKKHGIVGRSKVYKLICLYIIELLASFVALFEYVFFPKTWHLTRKKGI